MMQLHRGVKQINQVNHLVHIGGLAQPTPTTRTSRGLWRLLAPTTTTMRTMAAASRPLTLLAEPNNLKSIIRGSVASAGLFFKEISQKSY